MDEHDAEGLDEPPVDPEEWTPEQWIAWLKATDAANEPAAASEQSQPVTTMGRIVSSGGGQVIGSAMLGMAQAIYGIEEDEVVHVVEANTEPEGDEPFVVHLDPDHPERSTVVFRDRDDPADDEAG
jgi:hypothetical protein